MVHPRGPEPRPERPLTLTTYELNKPAKGTAASQTKLHNMRRTTHSPSPDKLAQPASQSGVVRVQVLILGSERADDIEGMLARDTFGR